ncbi:MAG: hypothetical protein FWE20_12195 [Defluviitaleaceae bacterium]|nr:hypothetical protein [Defluviitaleaceae bacterium]
MLTITTNGTLLTCEVYEWLVSEGVSIVISLDGPKPVHDRSRKYPDGRGSFDDIVANINSIREKHQDAKEELRFITVVNPEAIETCLDQVYSYDEVFPEYDGMVSFVNELYSEKDTKVSEAFASLSIQERAKMLLYMLGKLDRSKVSRLIVGLENEIELKHKQLRRIKCLPRKFHPGGPCLAGVERLFVSVDGIFYPCERVSESSEVMQIGDVRGGISVDKANAITNVGVTTAAECLKCWAIIHCNMCAAVSDSLSEFSKPMRLNSCANVKLSIEEAFKDICFLKSYGYVFEDDK